ncbi:hypothetical protein [Dyadobacter bucti]|uniref:hypothetical protein n=1 Tax=Dyadobacter bucti TaxID=2572203 RepID=UPI0011085052|nr:hypothetical protein [Dyadobacter bucti]
MKFRTIGLTISYLAMTLGACTNQNTESKESSGLEQQSVAVLRDVLAEQAEWVKVHAAEYLIWAGHPEGVKDVFLQEEKQSGTKSPYRIGIWRVLAQAATSDAEKKIWTDKIMAAFTDTLGTDRIHAAETLAKLRIAPGPEEKVLTENTLNSPVKPLALYTKWSVAFISTDSLKMAPSRFLEMIGEKPGEPADRIIPAYALRQLKGLSEKEWELLTQAALSEPAASPARIYLLSAAFTNVPANLPPQAARQIHTEIVKYKTSASKGEISEMAAALAEKGTKEDIALLEPLLTKAEQLTSDTDRADVAAAAAHAILRINKKQ